MKLSILIPHYKTFRWTAACIWHWKKFAPPVDHEIIVCDNSPGHPSIKCLTDTPLGENVTVVPGRPEFPSQGMGYLMAYAKATGDWVFTSETDSFPIKEGWFTPYLARAEANVMIGPPIPQSSGLYVHPAGSMVRRTLLDHAKGWAASHREWVFCPGAATALGLSDKGYHVVCKDEWLAGQPPIPDLMAQVRLWRDATLWQEMRSFDEDTFENYPQRTHIENILPIPGKWLYLKIGYEPGQWLHYYADRMRFPVFRAPVDIEWVRGHERRQAAASIVFDGFIHVWCGTVSTLPNDIAPDVRRYKMQQQAHWFGMVPRDIWHEIVSMEEQHHDSPA